MRSPDRKKNPLKNILTDSLLQLNHHDAEETEKSHQMSDSTIKNLNSKLDTVFKSSEMKIRSINRNNDSTTICSKKLPHNPDLLKNSPVLSQICKHSPAVLKYQKDQPRPPQINTSESLGKQTKKKAFKKKKKAARISQCDKDPNPRSLSRNYKLHHSIEASKDKKSQPKATGKIALLQRIFHKDPDPVRKTPSFREANFNHGIKPPLKTIGRKNADLWSLTKSLGRDPDGLLHPEQKRSKKIKKKIFDTKRKSYEISMQVSGSKRANPFEMKRVSEVSRSIDSNKLTNPRFSREFRQNELNIRRPSPIRQHTSILEKSLKKPGKQPEKPLEAESRQFKKFFAKKKSEPNGQRHVIGIFDKKKKSVENRLQEELKMKGIEAVQSHRHSMTIECIKNMLKKKKQDQEEHTESKFFLKKNQKTNLRNTNLMDSDLLPSRVWELNAEPKRMQISNVSEKQSPLPGPTTMNIKVHVKRKSNKSLNEKQIVAESCCLDIEKLLKYEKSSMNSWGNSKLPKARSIAGEYLTNSLKASFARAPGEKTDKISHMPTEVRPKQKLTPYMLFDVGITAKQKSKPQ